MIDVAPVISSADARHANACLTLTGMTVQEPIQSAYSVQSFELIPYDGAVLKQRVDVVAKAAGPATVAEMHQMLQPMLEQRFKLATAAHPSRCS